MLRLRSRSTILALGLVLTGLVWIPQASPQIGDNPENKGSGNLRVVSNGQPGSGPPKNNCTLFKPVADSNTYSVDYTFADRSGVKHTYDGPVTVHLRWEVWENPAGTWENQQVCEAGATTTPPNKDAGYPHKFQATTLVGDDGVNAVSCAYDLSRSTRQRNSGGSPVPNSGVHVVHMYGLCDVTVDGVTYTIDVHETRKVTALGTAPPTVSEWIDDWSVEILGCVSSSVSPTCETPPTPTTPTTTKPTTTLTGDTTTTLTDATTTTMSGATTTTMSGATTTTMTGGTTSTTLAGTTTTTQGGLPGGTVPPGTIPTGGLGDSSPPPGDTLELGAPVEELVLRDPTGPGGPGGPGGSTAAVPSAQTPAPTPTPPSGVATTPGGVAPVAPVSPVVVASPSFLPSALSAPIASPVFSAQLIGVPTPALGALPGEAPQYSMVGHRADSLPPWPVTAGAGLWLGFVCVAGRRAFRVRGQMTLEPAPAWSGASLRSRRSYEE